MPFQNCHSGTEVACSVKINTRLKFIARQSCPLCC